MSNVDVSKPARTVEVVENKTAQLNFLVNKVSPLKIKLPKIASSGIDPKLPESWKGFQPAA